MQIYTFITWSYWLSRNNEKKRKQTKEFMENNNLITKNQILLKKIKGLSKITKIRRIIKGLIQEH